MDQFAATKGGHEFLYGTMPRLARNIEEQTKAISSLVEVLKNQQDSSNYVKFIGIMIKNNQEINNILDIFTINKLEHYSCPLDNDGTLIFTEYERMEYVKAVLEEHNIEYFIRIK